jgi:Mn2+/Fe2+ NRAMP family transporter
METLLGAVVSECLMVIVIMVSVGLGGFNLLSPRELAAGLAVAGKFAPILFGAGLVAAGFLALTVISLASAWGVVEALGLPRSRSFQVYLAESIPAVLLSLIIGSNLLTGILKLMSAFVFVVIVPGIMMGVIAADARIMGNSASSSFWKLGYWISIISVVSLGMIFWLVTSI